VSELAFNQQIAPYPAELAALVAACRYRPGWHLRLEPVVRDPADTHSGESSGLTLTVTTEGYDSNHPQYGQNYRVAHFFAVPPATYNRRAWQRWLFDRLCDVERHEAMEFFFIGDAKPFAPLHGPGNDPYTVYETATPAEAATSFRGIVKQ
jgi:hypothetical protein